MASVEELYQEIILDHNKRPRNYGELDTPSHSAHGDNPLCGDELRVQLVVKDDVVTQAGFTSQGCAISKASASMMTMAIRGKSLKAVRELSANVLAALTTGDPDLSLEETGDLASLMGVRKFPARLKCATLAWHALDAALRGQDHATTEAAGNH